MSVDRGRADFKIHGKGLSIDLDVKPTLPVATQETPIAHTLGTYAHHTNYLDAVVDIPTQDISI